MIIRNFYKSQTQHVPELCSIVRKREILSMKYLQIMVVATLFALGASCSNPQKENNMETNTTVPKISDFPTGEENTVFAQYFSGRSWLAPLTSNKDLHVPMNNVTFEPGCRNNWHSHTGGQILVAVGGVGYYQERGKAAVRMEPGDIIEIAPNVEHWHGAAPKDWFSHIAITPSPQTNQNRWLEPVSDAEYAEGVK